MYSLGHGIMAAKASTKKPKSGERKAFSVISASLTVTELKSMSSEISLTKRLIVALASLTPSRKKN